MLLKNIKRPQLLRRKSKYFESNPELFESRIRIQKVDSDQTSHFLLHVTDTEQ
jgi:hypothetical protein